MPSLSLSRSDIRLRPRSRLVFSFVRTLVVLVQNAIPSLRGPDIHLRLEPIASSGSSGHASLSRRFRRHRDRFALFRAPIVVVIAIVISGTFGQWSSSRESHHCRFGSGQPSSSLNPSKPPLIGHLSRRPECITSRFADRWFEREPKYHSLSVGCLEPVRVSNRLGEHEIRVVFHEYLDATKGLVARLDRGTCAWRTITTCPLRRTFRR